MSVPEEAIKIQQVGQSPSGVLEQTNSPIYHSDRFITYCKQPNKMYPDVTERENRSIQE